MDSSKDDPLGWGDWADWRIEAEEREQLRLRELIQEFGEVPIDWDTRRILIDVLERKREGRFANEECCRAIRRDGRACHQEASGWWGGYPVPLCPLHAEKLVEALWALVIQEVHAGDGKWRRESGIYERDIHELVEAYAESNGLILRSRRIDAEEHTRSMDEIAALRERKADLYFAKSVLGGDLIKIGRSMNVPARMRDLKAEPLLVVKGAGAAEGRLHKRLSKYRKVGEWFEPAPEVIRTMERIRERQLAA